MDPITYTENLAQTLGFQSLSLAKQELGTDTLLAQLEEGYISDNGNDGTILWTEVINTVNNA